MILEAGMKVLIAHRRLFESDHPRMFVGVVEGYESGLARVTGHTWIRDGYHGGYERKEDIRTKIVPIASGTVLVYQLDSSLDLDALQVQTENTEVFATDGRGFRMNLTEGYLHAAPASPPAARR
jgi:hypothetical protein